METREVEEIINKLRIEATRAKLELCRIAAAALMHRLESEELTVSERRALFERWLEVTRNGEVLEFVLELERRRDRETRGFSSPTDQPISKVPSKQAA